MFSRLTHEGDFMANVNKNIRLFNNNQIRDCCAAFLLQCIHFIREEFGKPIYVGLPQEPFLSSSNYLELADNFVPEVIARAAAYLLRWGKDLESITEHKEEFICWFCHTQTRVREFDGQKAV